MYFFHFVSSRVILVYFIEVVRLHPQFLLFPLINPLFFYFVHLLSLRVLKSYFVRVYDWFGLVHIQVFYLNLRCSICLSTFRVFRYLAFQTGGHEWLLLLLLQKLLCCPIRRFLWTHRYFPALRTQILVFLHHFPFSFDQSLSSYEAFILSFCFFSLQHFDQIELPTLIYVLIEQINLILFVLFYVFEILLKPTSGFLHRWLVQNWVGFAMSDVSMCFEVKWWHLLEMLAKVVLSEFSLWMVSDFAVDFGNWQMRACRCILRAGFRIRSQWLTGLFQRYWWCLRSDLVLIVDWNVVLAFLIFNFHCLRYLNINFWCCCSSKVVFNQFFLWIWANPLLSMGRFHRHFFVKSPIQFCLFENIRRLLNYGLKSLFR